MATERYLNLVTSEHRHKPKYIAMIDATTAPLADLQIVLESMPPKFNLDAAEGVQLDVIGQWAGAPREIVAPPADLYVDFGYVEVGYFVGDDPYDRTIAMDDDTYRMLIRAKIGANHWDGTMETTRAIFDSVFPADSQVFLQDNQDMSITVGVVGAPLPPLFEALLSLGYLPLKPEGVRIRYVLSTVPRAPVFGFDIHNQLISGFDTGAWGKTL